MLHLTGYLDNYDLDSVWDGDRFKLHKLYMNVIQKEPRCSHN